MASLLGRGNKERNNPCMARTPYCEPTRDQCSGGAVDLFAFDKPFQKGRRIGLAGISQTIANVPK